jgi:hypothetical protein
VFLQAAIVIENLKRTFPINSSSAFYHPENEATVQNSYMRYSPGQNATV